MENIEPRYAYFTATGVPDEDGLPPSSVAGTSTGFICVRMERPKGDKHCRAAFSFCSPLDADQYWDANGKCWRFNDYKPLARKIADARALTKRVKATIEFDHEGPIGEAFRRALELAKTTERPWHKRNGTVHRGGEPPTLAPRWFKKATTVEFGLVQPEVKANRMDRGDPPA